MVIRNNAMTTRNYAIVVNNIVVNVATSERALEPNWIQSDTAQIGWIYSNGEFTAPEPEPVEPTIPEVPTEVTPLQIRRALRQLGLYDSVATYIETQSDDVKDAWEYAITIYRNDSMIISAGEALGVTDDDIDDLFRLAQTL
jgi:hypothetical protein